MNLSDIPAKFNIPFADSAGGGYIRTVPQTPTGTPGQASLQTGFPPENFEPVAAGGVPPFGQDFNGLLHQSTGWNRWQAAGVAFPPYDPTFQTAIGGYPHSALVMSLVEDLTIYYSLVDNNVTNPDAGGAGWYVWSRKITTNTDIYVNGSTGNDSNNGLSPSTAKATIQAAINEAWTFPPSQYTITIHVAAGTYAGAITPLYPGPNVVVTGAGIGSTLISSGSNYGLLVQGPNTMTVSNLTVQNSAPTGTVAGFAAQSGSTMITSATASGACGGSVFGAGSGSTMVIGDHTFSGSAYVLWWASAIGLMTLNQGATYTFSTAITVTVATAFASGAGNIAVSTTSPPSFVNPGNVTGSKYYAAANGIVNTDGQGINFFPGSGAGSTASGGQYL
jgi:hypothetical protein